ncbi:potassium transporter TrkA [Parafrankia colletiae]|uniref:Potassium transporter TrkA n=1 Tax=Parafrankia colletiae TaxID=573497 RepID=A0A1S1QCZ4_9ACTN|nr:NAD-binding protein [Parafrankia colletiae]MCK9904070.1 NAD-binding protein [Frankia sp. Cpl3]OHV30952.1 potassium transporter TrkA [Parafrankia colletiae]
MGGAGPSGTDHVIVCGLNSLGMSITEHLDAAGVRVVVVDDRGAPGLRRRLERLGVTLVPEGAEHAESLREAGLDRALALVACGGTDLENLRTCLVAAEAAPGIRIVANIDNPQLGRQLQDSIAEVRVLSVGGLAGPGFVEACLQSSVIHAFAPAGTSDDAEILAVVDEDVPRRAAFHELYGDLTPISLRRAGERRADICPPRDVPVAPGDRLVVLGRLSDLRARGLSSDDLRHARVFAALAPAAPAATAATEAAGSGAPTADGGADAATAGVAAGRGAGRRGARQPRGRRLRALAAVMHAELDAPFRRALAVVTAVTAVSTVVLALTYRNNNPAAPADFDTLDALYLTVGTMVTVGYGDYNFGTADTWLQVFGICLMLFGALAVAVVYAFITNVIVSRRLERILGIGQARTVHDHAIICGLGPVGVAAMDGLLRAGRPVVVVERDENNRYLPVARERGVPVVIGDATVGSTLVEAGLERATTIAAMTGDGHANLETVLSARQARVSGPGGLPLRVVARVLDTALADDIEHRFGIRTARSAIALAVPYFLAAAVGQDVVSSFYAEQTPFLVVRMTKRDGDGDGDGDPIGSVDGASAGVRVLGVSRAGAGDAAEMLVVGPASKVISLGRRDQRPPPPAAPR